MRYNTWVTFVLTLNLIVAATSRSDAESQCDAEIVRAFADVTKYGEKEFSYKRVMSHSCKSQTLSSGMSITLPVDSIPIGGSGNLGLANNACLSQNEEYFRFHARELFLMQTSDSVKTALISACFNDGKVHLVASENSGGITVTAVAGIQDVDNIPVIETFDILPPKGATRVGKNLFSSGRKFGPKGLTQGFVRAAKKDLTFTMNAKNAGEDSVTVPGEQSLAVSWRIKFLTDQRRRFICIGKVEGSEKELKTTTPLTQRLLGFPGVGLVQYLVAHCALVHGQNIKIDPGTKKARHAPDRWELSDQKGATNWKCKRNDEEMGEAQCPVDNLKACELIEGQKAICVANFGNLVN